jgi:flavorubredoxin
MQFNQFLVKDDEPLLFHTGFRAIFPDIRDAVATIMDPARLRWIGFSHFEADECGALNEWLAVAPQAQAACSQIGALVSINDFASRPARPLADGEVLATGRRRFRFLRTPHVPHCWEAGVMFEESESTLLCSDLFHHNGDVEPVTESDVVSRAEKTLVDYEANPVKANYMPYTPHTERILHTLAELAPRRLAIMHGSTFVGDGGRALRDLAHVMKAILGRW